MKFDRTISYPVALAVSIFGASFPTSADEYAENFDRLITEVGRNPLTKNGYWLETKNAFNDWEKLLLIFGYADPGDEPNCLGILAWKSAQDPSSEFRCKPVN